ncbi:MAG TPA: hypothetical protein VFP72_12565, partial [Kineosporiaceae bacterium]|nr:hypothetical protein [Kineosporiaceae bacterium]
MTSPDRLYRTSPDRLYPTSPTGLPGVGLFAARVEPTDTGSQPLPGVLLGHEAFAGTSTSLVELLTPPDGLPSLPAGRRRRRTRVGFSLMAALTLVAMGVITETSPLITLPWLPHSSATAGTGSWPSPLTGSVARASGLGWASTGASGTGSADPAATDPDPSETSVPEPEASDG